MPWSSPVWIHGVETGIEYVIRVQFEAFVGDQVQIRDHIVTIKSGTVMTRAELREMALEETRQLLSHIADTRPGAKDDYGDILGDRMVSARFYP